MTDSKYLLDTSAWIGFLQDESDELKELLLSEDSVLLTSALSFYEITKKFNKRGISERRIKKSLGQIRENCETVQLSGELCEKAAGEAIKYGLHAIDALIYRSALENDAVLVTMDYDFEKLPGVRIVKQSR